jgi:hypothetical protein
MKGSFLPTMTVMTRDTLPRDTTGAPGARSAGGSAAAPGASGENDQVTALRKSAAIAGTMTTTCESH